MFTDLISYNQQQIKDNVKKQSGSNYRDGLLETLKPIDYNRKQPKSVVGRRVNDPEIIIAQSLQDEIAPLEYGIRKSLSPTAVQKSANLLDAHVKSGKPKTSYPRSRS